MKKKLVGILVCMLMLTTTFSVMAGDEQDPEIIDDESEEFDLFGPLLRYQFLERFFLRYHIFTDSDLDAIDILSAWIFEKSDDPDYLFASIKVRNLQYVSQRSVFSVHWSYNGKNWGVGSHCHTNGRYVSCFAGEDRTRDHYEAECTYDLDNSIITFKLRKDIVGNPQPGDKLINTWAWTCLRFSFEPLSWIFGGELAKDYAPGITETGAADYGRDYEILY
jgi:hypothetical protein